MVTPLLAPFDGNKPTGLDLSYLQADTRLLIVAGSDTISATLVYMFYHLAQNPSIASKARGELEAHCNDDGSFNHREAIRNEYINGVINEALRMHPPVPSNLQRLTPPEGLKVGKTFIPGDTNVLCPQYTLGRCEYSCSQWAEMKLTMSQLNQPTLTPRSSFQSAGQQDPNSSRTKTPSFPSRSVRPISQSPIDHSRRLNEHRSHGMYRKAPRPHRTTLRPR